ncbi:MAG: CehA/McbA family metallohydrolase, partial [Clostridia bacterium]
YFAGTPYDGENHLHIYQNYCPPIASYRAYYRPLLARLARPDYLVDPGGEFIKYRYGHIVLANFEEKPPVDEFRDPLYHAYEKERHVPGTVAPDFTNLPPSQALKRYRNANSFAFFAHPTSWWREERSQSFVTNIASTVAFDALTGMVDAIVVEGYGANKPWYRGIWYALLDAGCRMTGVAETDTCGDDPDHLSGKRMVEPFRTYAHCEKLNLDLLSAAVRRGDCFATSGPLLDLTLDGARPGSVLSWDENRRYVLAMRGWRCCDGELTEWEVVVNGETVARIVPDAQGNAQTEVTLPREGYVLCILRDDAGNVAVGNPVYVRNTPFLNECFRAHVVID